MIYLLATATALFLSFSLTLAVIRFCYLRGVLSTPRKRDIHKYPIPRIGGVAIVMAFVITTILYFTLIEPDLYLSRHRILGVDEQLLGILCGTAIIAASMLYDDLRGLKAWQKFIFQSLAVFAVIASGVGIDSITNPFGGSINLNSVYIPIPGTNYHFSLWSDLLTLVWMIGMMNVINFVDGIDGLAAGLSIIALSTIAILAGISGQGAVILISLIVAGSTAGFLFLNYPPAKVFMGDSGSMFLGFILGVLPLLSGGKLATSFLVLGFPIVDGLFVAIGRLARKQNPFTSPDNTHLHHRFISAGFSQRQALWFLWLIAGIFAWVALRSTTLSKMIAAIALAAILLILIWYLSRKKLLASSK